MTIPYQGAYSRRRFSNAAVVSGISSDYQQDPGSGSGNGLNIGVGDGTDIHLQNFKTLSVKWDSSKGSVTGSGNFNARDGFGLATAAPGDTITLTARANQGYHFVKWGGGVLTSTNTSNPISIKMNTSVEVTAVFAKDSDDGTPPPGGNDDPGPLGYEGGENPPSGSGSNGRYDSYPRDNTMDKVKSFVKKWWWAILIVAYIVYKERAKK